MSEHPAFSCTSFLLLCCLSMTMMASGFPLRNAETSEEGKEDEWGVRFPFISLRDWSIQMMSAPSLTAAADSKKGALREEWLFAPERMEASVEGSWPPEWPPQGAGLMKRNMVMADDAAFREKSKLLTSMERQKWLNSYMQKLLVVNSS
ncbi:hypothetical protein LDENG_00144250 [Lucifuga dentata]|nr:hypothetical protein LDENG_00144250 [Lucifuga dentata]